MEPRLYRHSQVALSSGVILIYTVTLTTIFVYNA